jgi:hypothetical protein
MVFIDFLKTFNLDPAVFCPFDITGHVNDSDSFDNETSFESLNIDSDTIQAHDHTIEANTWPSSSEFVTNKIESDSPEPQILQAGSRNIKCTQCGFCEQSGDFENGSDSFYCTASNKAIDDIYTSASGCTSYYYSEQETIGD